MAVHPRIFVSWSHKNDNSKYFIALLKNHVRLHNANVRPGEPQFEVWTDQELIAGDHWSDKIDEALDTSFALVIAVTPESMDSRYVAYEWAYRKIAVKPRPSGLGI